MIGTVEAHDSSSVERMVRYMVRSARAAAARTSSEMEEPAPASSETPVPALLSPRLETVAGTLQRLPQWAVWKAFPGGDTGWHPRPVAPATRPEVTPARMAEEGATFEAAVAALAAGSFAGVGIFLHEDDPVTVVVLEEAVTPGGIALTPEAARVVERLGSYTEFTPSGRGIQIFVRAVLPPGGRRREGWEMRDAACFLPVTGRIWPGAPADDLVDRQREIEALHAEAFPTPLPDRSARAESEGAPPESDDDLLAIAFGASNGPRIRALFRGDPSALAMAGGGDRAAADLALCSLLGFYTGDDPVRLDRLYRRSALYRPRWDAAVYSEGRCTYGQAVVAKALNGCLLFHAYPRSAAADAAVPAAALSFPPVRRSAAVPTASAAVPFTVTDPGVHDPLRLAAVQGRAQGMALREQVLTAGEAAALLKVSARLLRKTVRPWRRFGSTPAGDRWLLSDLMR